MRVGIYLPRPETLMPSMLSHTYLELFFLDIETITNPDSTLPNTFPSPEIFSEKNGSARYLGHRYDRDL